MVLEKKLETERLQRRIQNPVKQPKEFFSKTLWLKAINYFDKELHINCYTGF